ncbi:MAG: cbb3-type cytochrome oxidase assembly protein [Acidobacteria bacterium]|nr:cbb3-type cytochrome oxidase assembly protein [Acidobacteriota bacterium]
MGDYTYASVFWMYSLMALFVFGTLYFLVKALRSGAVRDDEAPKYRMLEDDVPEGGHHGEKA